MGVRHKSVADCLVRAETHAFFTAFAGCGVVDVSMAVPEKDGFAEHVVGAGFHVFPTSLTIPRDELDVFRVQVSVLV